MKSESAPAVDRRARRWVSAVLLLVVSSLAAVGGFNWHVDPFQQYRLASKYPPRFYSLHHRYVGPGLAKNAVYDTVLSGSSIMENTRNGFIGRACGGTAINLSMPAMSAFEQRVMLETALRERPLRRVLMVLDFNQFAGGAEERQEIAGPFPTHLYDRNPFNDVAYLLSGDVLEKSLAIVAGDLSDSSTALRIVRADAKDSFTADPDAPWFWGERKRFARDKVLRDLDLTRLNQRFAQPARALAAMQRSFTHNLAPLFAAHPTVTFDILWPPYSILVWLDFARRDQLDLTLAFKRFVLDATREIPHVRIFDFQAEERITHDLDRYTDIYHFDPAVNEWMIAAACSGTHRVSDEREALAAERQLRSQVDAIRAPEGLAAFISGAARSR